MFLNVFDKFDSFTVPYGKYEGINSLIEEAVGSFKIQSIMHFIVICNTVICKPYCGDQPMEI